MNNRIQASMYKNADQNTTMGGNTGNLPPLGEVRSLHQLIEQQVTRTPELEALRFDGQSLTYAELDRRANQCAHYLRELGVGPDSIVGVFMERSLELVVALVAILKAGGAYLPLDTGYPAARLRFLLDDANLSAVLTQQRHASRLSEFAGTVLPLDTKANYLACYPDVTPEHVNRPCDLAYVIYTSGSTGQPKGCLLPHGAICNRLLWMQDEYGLRPGDRVLQKTPYTFDVSVWEFFWPLLAGATLVLAAPQGHKDSHYLVQLIRSEGITMCHFVPSMLRFFLNDADAASCTSLRDVFTSGEALPFDLVQRFKELLPARLHNLYGPTEAAVDVSYWECEVRPDRKVPIGRAIRNIRLYILDADRRPVPRGGEGELYIAGVGLARGYLRRPQLTAERFVDDPFHLGEKMYRTGDRAVELDDGNIDFLGRIDFQVKLRGLRIELGEIETLLRQYEGVREVAVLVRGEDEGDPKLVAYLEAAGCAAIDSKALRRFVATQLPEYMVPSLVVTLPQLPVTVHGKLDCGALPWPVPANIVAAASTVGSAASTPAPAVAIPAPAAPVPAPEPVKAADAPAAAAVQARLGEIVAAVLKQGGIAADTDLFDLGATSLTLVRVVEQIRTEFGIAVPLDVFLDAPTVAGIAAYVAQESAKAPAVADAPPVPCRQCETPAASAPAPEPVKAADAPVAAAVQARLGEIVAAVLKQGGIAADTDLFDLGATSLTLVRVVEQIRTEFGIAVPLDVFLDAPTVAGIAAYVAQESAKAPAVVDAPAVPCQQSETKTAALADIPLQPVAYRADTCVADGLRTRFSGSAVSFEAFSAWLGLLMAGTAEGGAKYRYASGGGLNPVRTYAYLQEGGVPGLPGGAYYYHPEAHALYRVGEGNAPTAAVFWADAERFAKAAFAVFFVAEMDAIEPLYQQAAATLVALDAGYMSQLLLSAQEAHGLIAAPATQPDFDRLFPVFGLAATERFVQCLLVGVPLEAAAITDVGPVPIAAYAARTCVQHEAVNAVFAGKAEITVTSKQLHEERRHLRRMPADAPVYPLAKTEFAWSEHRLRASCREYEPQAVSVAQLSRLLGMVRRQSATGGRQYLYGAIGPSRDLVIYVYLRGGEVPEGLYRYDAERHRLMAVGNLTAAQVEQVYTPYNRKHFKQGSFCLFVFGRCGPAVSRQVALHAALLDTGHLGQLLLERQAEFGLGLCPIGAIRFERIEQAFGLTPDLELLHSFIGGVSSREVPASRQRIEAGAAPVPRTEGMKPERTATDGIAIVGISGRYPGAENLGRFWQNLRAGVSSIGPLPAGRQAAAGGGEAPAGGYLTDIACFDSLLFGIAPVEACGLDPQERLLLEEVWASLEDAGYTAEALAASSPRVGVFVGAMWNDYQSVGLDSWRATGKAEEFSHHASLANRISYVFDFAGPSVAVNTSCASGVTALHLAAESIRRGECDAAIVGGVNLLAHPYHARLLADLGLLSKDGCARPLSAEASGWAPGEGAGAVVLKSLRRAEQDGDHIHAVIQASYVGHSGKSIRYGAPNARRQAEHLRQLLADAGLTPADIDYIEAAAPGASLADAAELAAVNEVFGQAGRQSPCFVGTVKANIGHLESASGLSQLAKVVLQLAHGELAPALNSEPRNPLIALDEGRLSVVTRPTPWPGSSTGRVRHALINAVGAAGSAGHLIVAEYMPPPRAPQPDDRQVVLLSAATAEQLRVQVERLHDFLGEHADTPLTDLAFTLRVGRVAMRERLAIVVDSAAALRERLQGILAGGDERGVCRGTAEDGQPTAAKVAGDDAQQLAAAWVQGLPVDWSALDRPGQRRISLPTYPFEAVRHWLDAAPAAVPSARPALPLPSAAFQAPTASPEETRQLHALEERTHAFLVQQLAQATGIPPSRITVDRPLEALGLNSMIIQELNARLEQGFANLPKTVFFEHRTLRSLAAYLIRAHRPALVEMLGMPELSAGAAVAAKPAVPRAAAVQSRPASANLDIAVVGLAGRYPQAETLEAFWRNLAAGRDSIEEVPRERWDFQRYTAGSQGTKPGKWGGFLRDVDAFDPLFFNIAPLEAERMDPQERLVLQTAWHTFEDAGYSRSAIEEVYQGRVGVFIGVMYSEYQLFPSLEQGLGICGSYGTIANRVSYVLTLRGPSMAVDTMCSSSLTAVHLACESIRRGDCACAIAGGVNLSLHPNKYITHALLNMPSSDGRCRSFGAGGDGFVPSEGVGAVLLKPLDQAIADGDHVYGVIKGSAINHGGKTNGYTVPNPEAHQELIADALRRSGLDARAISYVEAHGTGTALGDPIEIAGLSRAFGEYTGDRQFCAIGSVKSNIGHAEGAAGIAGLTKVLLQMQHGQLVPSLHSQQPNPNIDFAATPFVVQHALADWTRPVIEFDGVRREYPRIAGISSFGAGGANAHLIVEEYRPAEPAQPYRLPDGQPALVVLSAKNADRLREGVRQLLEAVEGGAVTDANLADAAYTLQVGREPMESRLALVTPSVVMLREQLQRVLQARTLDDAAFDDVYRGEVKKHRDELSILAADEDMAGLIAGWVAKGKHGKLLELWVKGLGFDWNRLYGEQKPRRISLPTYPFARDRYWIPEPESAPSRSGIPLRPAAGSVSGFDREFFKKLFKDLDSDLLSVETAVAQARKKI